MQRYFKDVRAMVQESGQVFEKTQGVADTLNALGINYPLLHSEVTADAITANSGMEIWKELNKYAKRLSASIDDDIDTEDNKFAIHFGFKVNGSTPKENSKYIPFTLAFKDGQVLTVLAKNDHNAREYQPKKAQSVALWILNKQDITKAIYLNGDRDIDVATTVARLKKIIERTHLKFVKANPQAQALESRIDMLKSEIEAISIDFSNVVEDEKTYIDKSKGGVDYQISNFEIIHELSIHGNFDSVYIQDGKGFLLTSKDEELVVTKDEHQFSIENTISKKRGTLRVVTRNKLIDLIVNIRDSHLRVVTNENISSIYSTLTDKEKQYSSELISNRINSRHFEIERYLKLTLPSFASESSILKTDEDYSNLFKTNQLTWEKTPSGAVVGQTFFGVKDNFKPLDDYIEDIKNSKGYKEFISNTIKNIDKEAKEQSSLTVTIPTDEYMEIYDQYRKNKESEKASNYNFNFDLTATNASDFEKQLDELADKIEEAGLMDENEDKLNLLAYKLTEMMKSENE